ncbi:MAG: ABC transporter permease [Trueperaceae bacterium]|nr:ABC transporter permease [Trueperaceae bacterium]MCC6311728.1 ABC transporter permease [Trueperaceae bacterium]MCO5173155.1 ABC transporter permease [Trueperaceae bacterium]MCW5818443.1 ABC transporter permease [Trueperaceae bacterium]
MVGVTQTESRKRSDAPAARALRSLRRNVPAMLSIGVLVILVFVAVFAPQVAPHDYAAGDLSANFARPGARFPLGADFLGRDMLSRLIYGTRISLAVAFLGAFFAFTVGLVYGVIAGYFGGRLDDVLMRIVDVLYAFPGLLFIILLMVAFKTGFGGGIASNPVMSAISRFDASLGGMFLIIVGISLTSWVGMARLTRGMALALRHSEFITAAKALGASNRRIIFKHLVPAIAGPLIVQVTLSIPAFIGTEAFLSFIGIGVTPPTPSWGTMIAEGFSSMRSHPHLAIYPGLALAIVMLAFNFLGDGLRDALDPHSR